VPLLSEAGREMVFLCFLLLIACGCERVFFNNCWYFGAVFLRNGEASDDESNGFLLINLNKFLSTDFHRHLVHLNKPLKSTAKKSQNKL
jgi:hypothetical protein